MINLLHIVSVPILAFNLGFVNPQIDLNHNIRETYKTQVIQQKRGTDEKRLANEIGNSKRFKEWSKKQKENKKSKSDKLESTRTRRGSRNFRNRDFTNRLRERFNERDGDQRRVAQFYVHSWFVASFSLDLDDNTLLRTKDIYAKAISEVGLATKGIEHLSKEKRGSLRKIHSTFDRELKGTLDIEQYKKLIEMTTENGKDFYRREKKVDKGET